MLSTGWNKEEGNRTFFNYYIVAPFSNDQKAQNNRFKYLAGSFGIAACSLIAGFGPISLIYQLGVAALIMKEWYTTLSKDRVIQKISLDSSYKSELEEDPDLESGNREFLKKINDLEKEIEELNEKLCLSADKSENLIKQVALLNQQLDSLKTENTEALTTIHSRDKQIEGLEEKRQAPQEEKQKEIDALNAAIQVKNLKIKELNNDISNSNSQVETNKKLIENYKEQVSKLNNDLDEKDGLQEKNLEKIEKLESEINKLTQIIIFNESSYKVNAQTSEHKIASLEKKITELEGFLDSAENEKVKLEADNLKNINDLRKKHLDEKEQLISQMMNQNK